MAASHQYTRADILHPFSKWYEASERSINILAKKLKHKVSRTAKDKLKKRKIARCKQSVISDASDVIHSILSDSDTANYFSLSAVV